MSDLADVTCLVKTFERPWCLRRLLDSIYRLYPHVKSVVVDDSKQPYATPMCQQHFAGRPIRVYELDYNVGISAGRNYGLERIETPYFVLLDDDYVFHATTDILRLLAHVRDGADIAGGAVLNYVCPSPPSVWFWVGHFVRYRTVLICEPAPRNTHVQSVDAMPCFFLARAESVKGMGAWDSDLKIIEHYDFFLRARAAALRMVYDPSVAIEHWPERDPEYSRHRSSPSEKYQARWMRKHGISHCVIFPGGVARVPDLWPIPGGNVPVAHFERQITGP